jgi:hypothetical protein
MDAFSLIQSFFSQMRCNFCSHSFEPDDIQLLRQEDGIYIVNVFCNHCGTQNGVAMVGVEVPSGAPYFEDPELTPAELERLAEFEPITADDVLDAHQFFNNLDSDWMKFIPPEMRQPKTEPQTESEDA